MRFVVFGAGAIGGVVAARLDQAGFDVALIARGAHLEAIRATGLTLLTPVERSVHRLPAAANPAELDVGEGDVVLLATKSQDTAGALTALRRAGADRVPIVCLQNGVNNERLALRLFDDVYGAVLMAPTAHLEPGIVESYGARAAGVIDVGRYPRGVDDRCEEIVAALAGAGLYSEAVPDVMRLKYAKLLLNLSNAVRALFCDGPERDELAARVHREGEAVLRAAEIPYEAPEITEGARRRALDVSDIDGRPRAGSSTWQSLTRGTHAIETDYLNGEIALLGRLHGVPAPLNAALCTLAERHAHEGGSPGELDAGEMLAVGV